MTMLANDGRHPRKPAMIRSILALLVAPALMPSAPLQAREKAKPVAEAAKPCPRYGAGFVRAPGSPTCVRVGGRVTAGIDARAGHAAAAAPVAAGRLAIDTRTETDYGPVRTFVRVGAGRR